MSHMHANVYELTTLIIGPIVLKGIQTVCDAKAVVKMENTQRRKRTTTLGTSRSTSPIE